MSTHNHEITNPPENNTSSSSSYALSGKIMLSAIVVLFFVVLLMFSLHIYARWYLLRARRRHSRNRRRSRRNQLVFYVDPDAVPSASRGLEETVLKSLPVFTFSGETNAPLECAVCLSEFEENESGRVLPECKHSFHLECIDMWFHSHSTCPLCRASVEGSVPVEDSVTITINEPSGSIQEATCEREEGPVVTSAVSLDKKLLIEVPKRNIEDILVESSGCDSGPSQSYKSPMMSQMLSFKRMLSRDRRVSGTNCSPSTIAVSDSDMERGLDETRQTQS